MYTGTLIEDLIQTVKRHEQCMQPAKPVTLRIAPRADIKRLEMEILFSQLFEMGHIQVGTA